jgi:3-oxoacyl-[acyl-carrier-protein] synthase II
VVVAGGAEAPFILPIVALFNRVGVMSKRGGDPAEAARPFDADRDGFVMGEGAAFLVLEREGQARARGARCRARLAGYGRSCDASSMLVPDPTGAGMASAIGLALAEGGLAPHQVDYVNAHGTATVQNDASEAAAIRASLGAWGAEVPVSSTKPVTGHLLGASGALEAVISILALEHQTVPVNLNCPRPDPACGLNVVYPMSRRQGVEAVLSNSSGFGGKNAVLLFTRHHDSLPAGPHHPRRGSRAT